ASPFTATLQISGSRVQGQVTNISNTPYNDVAIYRGGAVQALGTLAPGASAAVNLALSSVGDANVLLPQLLPANSGSGLGTAPAVLAAHRRAALLRLGLALPPGAGDTPAATVIGWGGPAALAPAPP